MILKRYGTSFHSVETNFNSRAITEVAFRRDRAFSVSVEEFDATYEKVDERAFTAETEGAVQDVAEEALLEELEAGLQETLTSLGDGEILVVESMEGADHPKTRDKKKNIIVDGENRLYFHWRIEPPLKMGLYRKKA